MPYFTIVFEGDIRDFDRNPMKIESAFGKPVASSIGDVFDDMAKLEEEIDQLRETLRPFVEADWYAVGNGKFQTTVSKEILDAAKRNDP